MPNLKTRLEKDPKGKPALGETLKLHSQTLFVKWKEYGLFAYHCPTNDMLVEEKHNDDADDQGLSRRSMSLMMVLMMRMKTS